MIHLQRGVSLDLRASANLLVLGAVHGCNNNVRAFYVMLASQLLPSGRQTFAMAAPGREKLDEVYLGERGQGSVLVITGREGGNRDSKTPNNRRHDIRTFPSAVFSAKSLCVSSTGFPKAQIAKHMATRRNVSFIIARVVV
jgi:hypothetical protein